MTDANIQIKRIHHVAYRCKGMKKQAVEMLEEYITARGGFGRNDGQHVGRGIVGRDLGRAAAHERETRVARAAAEIERA